MSIVLWILGAAFFVVGFLFICLAFLILEEGNLRWRQKMKWRREAAASLVCIVVSGLFFWAGNEIVNRGTTLDRQAHPPFSSPCASAR